MGPLMRVTGMSGRPAGHPEDYSKVCLHGCRETYSKPLPDPTLTRVCPLMTSQF